MVPDLSNTRCFACVACGESRPLSSAGVFVRRRRRCLCSAGSMPRISGVSSMYSFPLQWQISFAGRSRGGAPVESRSEPSRPNPPHRPQQPRARPLSGLHSTARQTQHQVSARAAADRQRTSGTRGERRSQQAALGAQRARPLAPPRDRCPRTTATQRERDARAHAHRAPKGDSEPTPCNTGCPEPRLPPSA